MHAQHLSRTSPGQPARWPARTQPLPRNVGLVPRGRIRCAKDTGLRNLPLHGFTQNQVWTEIVTLACELLAWTQLLALDGSARRWEPKRLRLRLFSAAGRLVRGGRRLRLKFSSRWPWAIQITAAITRLQALAPG